MLCFYEEYHRPKQKPYAIGLLYYKLYMMYKLIKRWMRTASLLLFFARLCGGRRSSVLSGAPRRCGVGGDDCGGSVLGGLSCTAGTRSSAGAAVVFSRGRRRMDGSRGVDVDFGGGVRWEFIVIFLK